MDEMLVPPSQKSDFIHPIGRDTIHRICSGQVVLSLAIAVKELVENAIDASATIIDIQLIDYGSELIQISDNGSGVKEENFQALTLKHYTSKIEKFDDLTNLSTLGFRGEALSSLCALSDLTISTKHKLAENATKLKYDKNGKIVDRSVTAREVGTTVILENLFSTLPVRRKEFLKNLKREFNKMCQLLFAYCLVSKGVKFQCTNITNKGTKNTIVATDGLNSVKDNIINVFGSKQIASLVEVQIFKPSESILTEFGVEIATDLPFSFEFFISSVIHGSGRSTTDRQFFYINSRPCEPTKVIKLINETYRQYNNHQYPFIYLNIKTKSALVDVNVTPDKRQIFLEKEKILLATIKSSLIEVFQTFPSTFKCEEVSQLSIRSFIEEKKTKGIKRSLTESSIKKGSILGKFQKRCKTESDKGGLEENGFVEVAKMIVEKEVEEMGKETVEETEVIVEELKNGGIGVKQMKEFGEKTKEDGIRLNQEWKDEKYVKIGTINDEIISKETPKTICKNDSFESFQLIKTNSKETLETEEDIISIKVLKTICKHTKISNSQSLDVSIDSSIKEQSHRKSISLDITLENIKNSIAKKSKTNQTSNIQVKFHSKITPECNKSAEEELRKQISKDDFKTMTIIGQFNLGFIITKLENDLFIIDQHATDEKYNFEQLQANTVLENQLLVNPKPLQLTAGNESLLIENLQIFERNGFKFKIDESAPCTKKISLTSVPLSKSVIFGKDDIDEMLFLLQDSTNEFCRPSRIRGMFASRACRMSIMIGKALTKSDMRKLIDHMGEIEQPWNCPHGRPTIRHLINLDLIQN